MLISSCESTRGLARKRRLTLTLIAFVCIIWTEIVQVNAAPMKFDLKKLYVNVPGNVIVALEADPNKDSAGTLKVKLLKALKEQNLRPYNKKDWIMDEYVLTYFSKTISRENAKLSKYHVIKGGTMYLVQDI